MIVVLCHSGDYSAQWVAGRLRARTGELVEVVLVESLASPGTSWHQEIRDVGSHVAVTLDDGRKLRSGEVKGVLNRMIMPAEGVVRAAVEGDEGYARNELTSFAASWLRGLAPRVVNPPTPQGLSGRWRPVTAWRLLALEAGLNIRHLALDSTEPASSHPDGGEPSTTVLTIGDMPLSDSLPTDVRAAAGRLAALADTPVLGLRFQGLDPNASGWRFLDATPYPDLTLAGEAGVEALQAELSA